MQSLSSLLLLCIFGSAVQAAEPPVDVVVYGATSAGVAAAVQAARMKHSVVLIEPGRHLGGLTSGGLGATDIGNKKAIGGISRQFYQRIYQHYSQSDAWSQETFDQYRQRAFGHWVDADTMWGFEPRVAEQVFRQMLAEAGVTPVLGERLNRKNGVRKQAARITSITMQSGREFSGKMFIDASYEGDLMAAAGVKYTIGREANTQYGETLNGVETRRAKYHQFEKPVDPYVKPGNRQSGLLPSIHAGGPGEEGSGDRRVQAYNFRMCLTNAPDNRLPFPKPAQYDPLRYEPLLRYIEAGGKVFFTGGGSPMPNQKTDTNNSGPFSTDNIGMNYEYPDGDDATREKIIADHRDYQLGMLWTLANNPRVPAKVRESVNHWGLAQDEFTDNNNWPHQLYVREARRMVSDYVMQEQDCRRKRAIKDSVGLGAYSMDSHHTQRYVDAAGLARNEGDVETLAGPPYPISYRSIVPKAAECTNLLVPVCLSASHIAYGSIRMEPVFMVLGQSAATAAAQAIEKNCAVQAIDYSRLRERLVNDKQVLSWDPQMSKDAPTQVEQPKMRSDASMPAIIPMPMQIEHEAGKFVINASTRIVYDDESLKGVAAQFKSWLGKGGGIDLKLVSGTADDAKDAISLTMTNADRQLGDEGYELAVSPHGVTVRAPKAAGVFYGIQTLRQLLPSEIEGGKTSSSAVPSWTLPYVKIKDKPRFPWRSMMLDVSRAFVPKDGVKRYLDLMACYKMNVFHWHLTDDQGWRVEIKKYPKLTEIGAWRERNGSRYGGFYTQEDIKEIVQYAMDRHIMVVPEIEMPGHSTAALAAYPELSCGGGPFVVPNAPGIYDNLYCAGNDKTFEFLEDVISELVPLFPSPYFHIGGDECGKRCWKNCSKCQARMTREGLKTEAELQAWFTKRMDKFLRSKNRRLIGWDEILGAADLSADDIVQVWRNGLPGQPKYQKLRADALSSGHSVIMSPWNKTYLCYPYKLVSIKTAYEFDPTGLDLSPELNKRVMGLEACCWTDVFMNASEHAMQSQMDHYIFPRLCAHAETGWSQKTQRDWTNFSERLERHFSRLEAAGVSLISDTEDLDPSFYRRVGEWHLTSVSQTVECDLSDAVKAPGTYEVKVQYIKGKNAVAIDWVALMENRKEILRDAHKGESGFFNTANSYYFYLPAPVNGANYRVIAKLNGKGGANSNGEFRIVRLPALALLGHWSPDKLQAKPEALEWDASAVVSGGGKYEVRMSYTGGNNALVTKWVALLVDGKEIARDTHLGLSGFSHENHVYHLDLPKSIKGEKYLVRAQVEGKGGDGSNGVVWMRKAE